MAGLDQVTQRKCESSCRHTSDQDENRITLVTPHLLHKKKNELATLQSSDFRRDGSKWKADRIAQPTTRMISALLSQLSRNATNASGRRHQQVMAEVRRIRRDERGLTCSELRECDFSRHPRRADHCHRSVQRERSFAPWLQVIPPPCAPAA